MGKDEEKKKAKEEKKKLKSAPTAPKRRKKSSKSLLTIEVQVQSPSQLKRRTFHEYFTEDQLKDYGFPDVAPKGKIDTSPAIDLSGMSAVRNGKPTEEEEDDASAYSSEEFDSDPEDNGDVNMLPPAPSSDDRNYAD